VQGMQNTVAETIFIRTADMYGCETWSLILREEHRLKVSENRNRRLEKTKRCRATLLVHFAKHN
jgi:hypothetical protein